MWGGKSCGADVTSLEHTGFVVWVFERLVGHLIARPGQRSKAISVPDGWGGGRLLDVDKAGKHKLETQGSELPGEKIEYLLEFHLISKKYLSTHRVCVMSGHILGELG